MISDHYKIYYIVDFYHDDGSYDGYKFGVINEMFCITKDINEYLASITGGKQKDVTVIGILPEQSGLSVQVTPMLNAELKRLTDERKERIHGIRKKKLAEMDEDSEEYEIYKNLVFDYEQKKRLAEVLLGVIRK